MAKAALLPLWKAPEPLILASNSKIRSSTLEAAGLPHLTRASGIDERAVEAAMPGISGEKLARELARAKSLAVSARTPGCVVIGADQTLTLEDRLLHKADSLQEARVTLQMLRGKSHRLHSALVVSRNHHVEFEITCTATLTMRDFSNAFLDRYLQTLGLSVLSSVGCYHFEGLGAQIFERVEGDYFTIMGLPLLPILKFFREANYTLA